MSAQRRDTLNDSCSFLKVFSFVFEKKYSMKKIILSFLLIATIKMFAVGPWVNPKGSLYTQLSYTFLSYDTAFSLSIPKDNFVTDFTLSSYTEYSITNRTALMLKVPLKLVGYNNSSVAGLGDVEIAGKTELFKVQGSPFSTYYNVTLPSSSRRDIVATSDSTSYQLNTGIDRFGFEGGISTGIGSDSYYALASVGYRVRSSINDQFVFEVEASKAFHIKDKKGYIGLSFTGAVNTSASTGTDELDKRVDNQSVLYDYESSYISPALKVSYNFHNNLWASLTGGGALYATYAGAAPAITIGVAYKLDK